MEKLTIDQMENLVGGNTFCEHAYILLYGGGFQGTNEQYLLLWDNYVANCPQA